MLADDYKIVIKSDNALTIGKILIATVVKNEKRLIYA